MKHNTDHIFKALADKSRRKILDIASLKPGVTVNELTKEFEFSRYAVMKHLKILEECELLIGKRDGKYKRLYLNAVPIQTTYDRWISKYSGQFAKKLTSLKYKLEEEGNLSLPKLEHVFIVYIKSTPEKVWEAIINSELTRQYYFGSTVKSDFKVDSRIEYFATDKEGNEYVPVSGKVLEIIPLKKLSHTFAYHGEPEKPSRVTYEIEDTGGLVKLTFTHDEFGEETKIFNQVKEGWSYIFSGLKTLLETSEPLKA